MTTNDKHLYNVMGEIYYRTGHLLLTGESEYIFDDSLPALTRYEQGFFYLYAASVMNNK
jgi:hypothetical protein